MQWKPARGPGTGFTTGKPWESAQPDSETTTVAAQDADSGSLLNLYRRLIHLRKANDALATGRLVALSAGSPAVAAYLRLTARGEHAVLVVANLGAQAASGVTIGSAAETLPPGRYEARSLVGGANGAALTVGPDAAVRGYVPVPGALAPRQALVLELIRR